jgi:hypothetical protein
MGAYKKVIVGFSSCTEEEVTKTEEEVLLCMVPAHA